VEIRLDLERRLVPSLRVVQALDDFVVFLRGGDGRAGGASLLERRVAAAVHGFARAAHVDVAPVEERERGGLLELIPGDLEHLLRVGEGDVRLERFVALVETLREAAGREYVRGVSNGQGSSVSFRWRRAGVRETRERESNEQTDGSRRARSRLVLSSRPSRWRGSR